MAIIRRRPTVVVRVPSTILPGDDFVAKVTLDAKSEVPVDFVDVVLEGKDEVNIGQSNQARWVTLDHLRLRALAMEEGKLGQGQTTLHCQFSVPRELPPSYRGKAAACSYVLSVHVSIPWWPDRKASFDVNVSAPRVAPPQTQAATYGSHPQGPQGDELTLECSLADHVIEPDGVLQAAVALGNLRYHRVRHVTAALVGIETVDHKAYRRHFTETAARYVMRLPVPEDLGDGDSIPIRMRVPDRAHPTWRSALWKLDWFLDVRAHVRLGRDVSLRIPVFVVPAGSAPRAERKAPPVIGSERVTAIWSRVAESLGMQLEGESMRARVHDTDVVVRREHRGAAGIFLVAELSYPDLHLGLDGGLSRGFRRIVGGGVQSGHAEWDRRHYLAARHPEQFGSVLRTLMPALAEVDLYDIDDEQALLQSREAGLTVGPLNKFASRALSVARSLHAARQSIPPPPGMEAALEAWKLLAEKLDGRLETARMAVFGAVDGAPIEIVTSWDPDGEPVATTLRTEPSVPPREEQLVVWESGRFVQGGAEGLPEPCREVLDELLGSALRFGIEARAIEVDLPAPQIEAGPLLQAAHQLVALAAGLRAGSGPYR